MKKKTQTTKQKQKTKCKKSLSWNEQFTVKKKKYKKKTLKAHLKIMADIVYVKIYLCVVDHQCYQNIILLKKQNLTLK